MLLRFLLPFTSLDAVDEVIAKTKRYITQLSNHIFMIIFGKYSIRKQPCFNLLTCNRINISNFIAHDYEYNLIV